MPAGALPLNVTPSSTPLKNVDSKSKPGTPDPGATPIAHTPPNGLPRSTAASGMSTQNVKDISSPHELTAFVETLLDQLDAKFEDMSTQMLDRMDQMTGRVDELERAIQDIINSDVPNAGIGGPAGSGLASPLGSVPQSPAIAPGTFGGPGMRRTTSGL